MQLQHAILLPPTALALLTGLVFIQLYRDRIAEIARPPHSSATTGDRQADARHDAERGGLRPLPQSVRSAGAVLCAVRLSRRSPSSRTVLLLACAWGYVVLRAAHTYVHLTSNVVIRRFQLFFASSIVLYVMWVMFALRLLTA